MTTIALTGSTGVLGGRVAHLLGARVGRLVVRDESRAPRIDGVDVRVASYDDSAAGLRALEGVDVLLMVSAAESPVRREQHRTFIASAVEAGVEQIVYTSFVGASPTAGFTLGRDHADTEQALAESGLRTTILRDSFYSDFLPVLAGDDRVIRGPAGEGRVAAVARVDVADAAAAVLRDPAAHAGRSYALTGPEAVTLAEAASRMSRALGSTYTFENQDVDEAYESRRQWSSEQWQLDAWVSTYTAIRDGELAVVSDDVERLTGHPARSLEWALRSR